MFPVAGQNEPRILTPSHPSSLLLLPLSLPSPPFFSASFPPTVLSPSSLVQSPSSDNVYDRKEISFAEVVTISAKSGSNPHLGNQLLSLPPLHLSLPLSLPLPPSPPLSPPPFFIFTLTLFPSLGIFKTDSEIGGRSNGPQSRELQVSVHVHATVCGAVLLPMYRAHVLYILSVGMACLSAGMACLFIDSILCQLGWPVCQ